MVEAGRVVDGTVSENSRTYSSCVPEPLYPLNSLPIAPPSSPCQPPLFSARFHASLIFPFAVDHTLFLKAREELFPKRVCSMHVESAVFKNLKLLSVPLGKVWVIVLLTVVQTLRCSRTFMAPTQKRKQNCVIHKILQENPVFGFSHSTHSRCKNPSMPVHLSWSPASPQALSSYPEP